MNEEKYTTLDELIKKSLHEKAKKDKDINLDEAWEKFSNRYNIKRRRTNFKHWAVACLLFLVVTTSLLMLPTQGTAINLKVFQSIKSFISGKVQTAYISFGKENKKDTVDYFTPEVYSVLKDVRYDILLPLDMMDVYRLEKAEVTTVGNSRQVDLLFNCNNSEVTITQMNIIGDLNQGNSFDTEDALMKKANVKGQKATLIVYKNGFSKLSWVDRDIFISIAGNISEDNILMLANSTKRINLQ